MALSGRRTRPISSTLQLRIERPLVGGRADRRVSVWACKDFEFCVLAPASAAMFNVIAITEVESL